VPWTDPDAIASQVPREEEGFRPAACEPVSSARIVAPLDGDLDIG
jgi:hypothetical protein